MSQESKKTSRFVQAAGAVSLLAFLAFNKLPVLGTIQSRFTRIITRLGLLVGPTLGVANTQI